MGTGSEEIGRDLETLYQIIDNVLEGSLVDKRIKNGSEDTFTEQKPQALFSTSNQSNEPEEKFTKQPHKLEDTSRKSIAKAKEENQGERTHPEPKGESVEPSQVKGKDKINGFIGTKNFFSSVNHQELDVTDSGIRENYGYFVDPSDIGNNGFIDIPSPQVASLPGIDSEVNISFSDFEEFRPTQKELDANSKNIRLKNGAHQIPLTKEETNSFISCLDKAKKLRDVYRKKEKQIIERYGADTERGRAVINALLANFKVHAEPKNSVRLRKENPNNNCESEKPAIKKRRKFGLGK